MGLPWLLGCEMGCCLWLRSREVIEGELNLLLIELGSGRAVSRHVISIHGTVGRYLIVEFYSW